MIAYAQLIVLYPAATLVMEESGPLFHQYKVKRINRQQL